MNFKKSLGSIVIASAVAISLTGCGNKISEDDIKKNQLMDFKGTFNSKGIINDVEIIDIETISETEKNGRVTAKYKMTLKNTSNKYICTGKSPYGGFFYSSNKSESRCKSKIGSGAYTIAKPNAEFTIKDKITLKIKD